MLDFCEVYSTYKYIFNKNLKTIGIGTSIGIYPMILIQYIRQLLTNKYIQIGNMMYIRN